MSEETWERAALREILDEALRERRRTRRWRLITRGAFLAVIVIVAVSLTRCDFGGETQKIGPHTAEVRIDAPIMADSAASAEQVIKGLNAAFETDDVAGVILRINSPGGSPVQAQQIYNEVLRLRDQHPDTPVYAVIEDLGASGAYFVAAAAERIYVTSSSIVGSIGVITGGFGLRGAMERLDIERRIYTAGENKAFLDPFAPERPEHVDHIKQMLDEIHQQFIDAVLKGRGDRLGDDADKEQLFSGLVWTGTQGIELGLVDEIGSVRSVAREVIGEEKVVDYTARGDFLVRIAERFGTTVAHSLFTTLQRMEIQPR